MQSVPEIVDSHLGIVAAENPGLRVPGAFDGTEIAVRAILGQQASVKGASLLASRLANLLGKSIVTPFPQLHLLTPTVIDLAQAEVPKIAALGIIKARAATIINLARAVESDGLSLEPGAEINRTKMQLKSIPGIGDWTAEYISMRCLGWPDAFPYSDLGIKKVLGLKSGKAIIEIAEKWRPWRSYAAMHLWKSLEVVHEAN